MQDDQQVVVRMKIDEGWEDLEWKCVEAEFKPTKFNVVVSLPKERVYRLAVHKLYGQIVPELSKCTINRYAHTLLLYLSAR